MVMTESTTSESSKWMATLADGLWGRRVFKKAENRKSMKNRCHESTSILTVMQTALGPDGKLLDASKIIDHWYHIPNDSHLIRPISLD